MRDDGAPLVHVRIAFRNAGAAHQDKSKVGVPIFYSSAVNCGCGKYLASQFNQAAENIATSISCEATQDFIYFSMMAPKMVLPEAVNLLKIYIGEPIFEKDKVYMERDSIIAAIRNYANRSRIVTSSIIPQLIFKGHNYENGLYGSEENFAKLSPDDLKKYKADYLVLNNATAYVFGDVTENEAIALVDNVLSTLQRGKASKNTVTDVTAAISSHIQKHYAEGSQSSVVFAMKSVKPTDLQRYAANVLYTIFGGAAMLRSRILSELRMRLGLIYSGNIGSVDLIHASYVCGSMLTDNAKVKRVIETTKDIVRDLRINGISQEELAFAKRNIKGRLLVGLRTSKRLCDFYFKSIMDGLGTDALDKKINGIESVTLEDVKKVANELLDENNLLFVVVGGNAP
jgi:zinc protease